MKTTLVIIVVAGLAASASGQAPVVLLNRDYNADPPVDAPVHAYSLDGPLVTGTQARAALLGGPAATGQGYAIDPATGAITVGNLPTCPDATGGNSYVNFRTGAAAGYVSAAPRIVSDVGFNREAMLQMVVWTGDFTDFAEAVQASLTNKTVGIGCSEPWMVATGTSELAFPPANFGLKPFALIFPGFMAPPAVLWTNAPDIVYGTPLSDLQLNASASVPGTFDYQPSLGTVLGAGTGQALSVSFTPADGPRIPIPKTVLINVRKRPLVAKAYDTARYYGQLTPAFAGSIADLQNNDSIILTFACSATVRSSLGTYDIVPVLSDMSARLANYTVTLVHGTLTILKAPLVAKADDKTREIGFPNPLFTGSLIGLRNNDAIGLTFSCLATSGSSVGTYDIVPSVSDPGGRLVNYVLTLVHGTLTVAPWGATRGPLIRDSEGFHVAVPTDPGVTYVLEQTDSLTHPNWQAGQSLLGTGETLWLTDPAATNQFRLYRIRTR